MSKVWKYGDDINTDMLFPGKYTYSCSKAEQILPHLLEDLDPTFRCRSSPATSCWPAELSAAAARASSRCLGLKAAGVAAVVAKGFARIFYRPPSTKVCCWSNVRGGRCLSRRRHGLS